jgi:uncharacterized protein YdaU (DUF1376 family)
MNFYPFHIGDYISHTHHLADDEDLAYRRMIDLYYQTEKPFTQTPKWLAKRVKTTVEIVHYLLSEFFEYSPDSGGWHNKRADEEIGKYHAMQEGGRKGAALRWNKGSNSPPISPPKQPPMQTKNQEPITNNHIKTITPEGVSDSIFKDYMEVRKAKKAKWTETALKGLQRESAKANITLQEAMQICCERGWIGFKAEWIQQEAKKAKELPLGTNEQIEQAYRVECGKDPALARFNSYFDMKNYIIKFREERVRA